MGKNREKGGALVVGLVALMTLGGITGALFMLEGRRISRVRAWNERERAFALAESGLDEVAVLLSANAFTAQSVLSWSGDGVDNDGDGLVDEGDETILATAAVWSKDGADNDGDGQTDESDERVARVTSRASIGTASRQVTGFLRQGVASLPEPVSSVYLNDAFANVNFSGSAFRIAGEDRNLDGTAGPASTLYGIAINGDPQQVLDQISPSQQDNITGTGGAPSVGSYSPGDPDFIQSVVDTYSTMADIVFPGGGSYNGDLGTPPTAPSWENGLYRITYSGGDLKISSGSKGAGVLLVRGDLEISGDWNYVGYVFVTGRAIFKGGGGSKRLQGALFVGGDVVQSSSLLDLLVTGTVDLFYSSQALRLIAETYGAWTVVAVSEP